MFRFSTPLVLLAACSFSGGVPQDGGPIDASVSDGMQVPDATPDPDAAPTCAALPAGAIAWWDGEVVGVDILGNFTTTNFNSDPESGPGLIGNAYELDNNDDVIVTPGPQAPQFTVETWVRREFDDLDYMVIYGLQSDSSLTLRQHRLVYFEPGGDIVQSTAEVPLNEFTHVAVTFDGTTTRLYINGLADGEAVATSALPDPGRIGGVLLGDGNDFVGKIDELTVYTRALAPSEISLIVTAGDLGKCKPSTL